MTPAPSPVTDRISVVVPSFNQGRWLGEALASLLDQGDPALEVIVVDGGSTDETCEVLDRWRPRLAACVSERDDGQAHAIAKGFALATGSIRAWLNSDDAHLPWTLETVRRAFAADPSLECLHGDRIEIDADGRVLGWRRIPGHSAYFLNRWPWTHQETCFWRRELYDRCGGIDTSLRFAMDYDLFARFFERGRCRHLPAFLGAFRWHDRSKSFTQQQTIGNDEIRVVRARYGCTPRWFERPIGRAYSAAIRLGRRVGGPRHGATDGRRLAVGEPIGALWHERRSDRAT
jgi:glycosyltransferase involved in cell wall biosynthesis